MVGSTVAAATQISTSWSQPVSAEHLLVCATITNVAIDPSFVASGWTQIGSTLVSVGYALAWWFRSSGTNEASAVTVSWTGVAGQAAQVLGEYSGIQIAAPLDPAITSSQNGLVSNSPQVTAAAANTVPTLYLAVVGQAATVNRSAVQDGFAEQIYQPSATVSLSLLDSMSGVPKTANPGCTLDASVAWAAAVAGFRQTPDQVFMPARAGPT